MSGHAGCSLVATEAPGALFLASVTHASVL